MKLILGFITKEELIERRKELESDLEILNPSTTPHYDISPLENRHHTKGSQIPCSNFSKSPGIPNKPKTNRKIVRVVRVSSGYSITVETLPDRKRPSQPFTAQQSSISCFTQ